MSLLGLFGKKRALRNKADIVFDRLQPSLSQQIPAGCHLNEKACREKLFALLCDDGNVDSLETRFLEKWRKTPTDYVDGLAQFQDRELTRQAKLIYQQLAPNLSSSLPSGCRLKEGSVVNRIKHLMETKAKPDELVKCLVASIQSAPKSYLDGLPEPDPQAIFEQIAPNLSSSLPAGCSLKKEKCIDFIKSLLDKGTKPDELVKKFVAGLESAPWFLVNGIPEPPPPPLPTFQTSAPQSINRSELRS